MTRALLACLILPGLAAADNAVPMTPPDGHSAVEHLPLDARDACLGAAPARMPTAAMIAAAQNLLDATPADSPERSGHRLRLALLYADAESAFEHRVGEARARHADGEVPDLEDRRHKWRLAAVKELVLIADDPASTRFPRLDEALFDLAWLLTRDRREDLARPAFKRLIKEYPTSRFIPDSYLVFGDYYLGQKRLENALAFYDKVLQFPDGRCYSFAKYQEGVVYQQMMEPKKALETFVALLQPPDRRHAQAATIAAARERVVEIFASMPTAAANKAWPFFQKVAGPDQARVMLGALAERYRLTGRAADAATVERVLATLPPL